MSKSKLLYDKKIVKTDCVGALECTKPYTLPTHTDPSNWDPQASNRTDGGLPETCSRSCAMAKGTMTPIVFLLRTLAVYKDLVMDPLRVLLFSSFFCTAWARRSCRPRCMACMALCITAHQPSLYLYTVFFFFCLIYFYLWSQQKKKNCKKKLNNWITGK